MNKSAAPYFYEQVEFVLEEPLREHGFLMLDTMRCHPLLDVNSLAFIRAYCHHDEEDDEALEGEQPDSYTNYVCFQRKALFLALAYHVSLEFHVLLGLVNGTELLPAGTYKDITASLMDKDGELTNSFEDSASLRRNCGRLARKALPELLRSIGNDESFAARLDEEFRLLVAYYTKEAQKEKLSAAVKRAESAFRSGNYAEVVRILNVVPSNILSEADRKRLSIARRKSASLHKPRP